MATRNAQYQLYLDDEPTGSYASAEKAIDAAKQHEAAGQRAVVRMYVNSGTYRSRTQVYPRVGETVSI